MGLGCKYLTDSESSKRQKSKICKKKKKKKTSIMKLYAAVIPFASILFLCNYCTQIEGAPTPASTPPSEQSLSAATNAITDAFAVSAYMLKQ